VGEVGNTHNEHTFRQQVVTELPQQLLGLCEMLNHIGSDDGVKGPQVGWEALAQICFDVAMNAIRDDRWFNHVNASDLMACVGEKSTEVAAAAPEIEDGLRSAIDQPGDLAVRGIGLGLEPVVV
jgi:hypothetical protein